MFQFTIMSFGITLSILVVTVSECRAYIDPGTGGMIAGSVSTILAVLFSVFSSALIVFRKSVKRLYANTPLFLTVLAAVITAFGLVSYFFTMK